MKFFKKLLSFTLIYKIIESIKNIYYYIRDYGYISDTLYSDAFSLVLLRYLNLEVKKDWIGRLYGIINPNIDINGNFNVNNMIIEIDGDNTNNNEQVKAWAYKQLELIGQLFKIQNLYDYIDLTFKHVGPKEADNYLLIFDMISRKIMVKSFKKVIIHAGIYAVIAALILLLI